ncbi:Nicotinamide mononucleotide adenylyltransferase family protein [uncultured Desulfobacterium sp.]|uniref:Nicotinamide mononucleotide adenylyltransferase family protein n=1 Tax=uncultured Desulfobacterium sp. TaxID=201089 RepID=A0A445MVT7_9BACT|nr:Nicotinamide mononucleotide adenylyltransferase family protein [uncultured Desulfobacterium sp.]
MITYNYEIGVIHGRFQVLHNDHLKYIMAGKAMCRHLVVGITNPDPVLSRKEETDVNRSSPFANPLTYYERYVLVKTVLEEGLDARQFSIVPFPVSFPELYKYYVPMDAVFFLSIYDEWGRKKHAYFTEMGLKTHILRDVPSEEKGLSATDIRMLMKDECTWEHLVPQAAQRLLIEWEIPARLKTLFRVSPTLL